MWWGRTDRVAYAWLGATRAAWWVRGEAAPVTAAVDSMAEAVACLATWRRDVAPRAARVAVLLDGDLCGLRAIPAIAGATGRDEAESALTVRLGEGVRGSLAQPIARVAKWPMEGPLWLVVEVTGGVLDGLMSSLGDVLVSVKPWWWRCMPAAGAGGRFAAFDGRSLSFCDVDVAGRLLQAGTMSPMQEESSARRWLRREEAVTGSVRNVYVLRWEASEGPSRQAGEPGFQGWVQRVSVTEQ